MALPPVGVEPFPGDDTPNLTAIFRAVKDGCGPDEKSRNHAQEMDDWYTGDSEKYVSFRPAEDALSWLTRPKRVSFITRQAVNKLTSHLYKPGPRARRVTKDDEVDSWYRRVAQDIALDSLMKKCDVLTHLQGLCAVGIYPTGDPARPINYHLYPRTDFCYWCNPDDPRIPVALCTVSKVDHETTRFRLWTKHAYYTFFRGKAWGYQAGGWGAARYDPGTSAPHPYGCLPFAILTHEIPTTSLETKGLGYLLAKINKALNIDMSNLALWVHIYAKPLPFVCGVGPEWRPRFTEGGFVVLPAKYDSTEGSPTVPEPKYLESSLDIGSVWQYIRGAANAALAEIDVPLTTTVQSDNGGGTMGASGLSIAAQDADLITYAKGRQPVWDRHENTVMGLVARIGACPLARTGALAPKLAAVAADPGLRVVWPEPYLDIPSRDRDDSDGWELANELTDPIELLMKRQGLTEPEAIDSFRNVQRRKSVAARIIAEESAAAETPEVADGTGDGLDLPDPGEPTPSDMGVVGGSAPSAQAQPARGITPNVTIATPIDPNAEIPAAPLLVPSTPGYGGWGTES
jgi:hypothetical protein